jgi:hypothetical protein
MQNEHHFYNKPLTGGISADQLAAAGIIPVTPIISLTALDCELKSIATPAEYADAKSRIFPDNKLTGKLTDLAAAYQREIKAIRAMQNGDVLGMLDAEDAPVDDTAEALDVQVVGNLRSN